MLNPILVLAWVEPSLLVQVRAAVDSCGNYDFAQAANAAELTALAGRLKPNVVLVDSAVAGNRLDPLLREVRECDPDGKILVFYEQLDGASFLAAVSNGAHGCLLKSTGTGTWSVAVSEALANDVVVPYPLLREITGYASDQASHAQALDAQAFTAEQEALTEREREVAMCLSAGMTNKEIGRKLGISPTTVKTHLKHMFQKLHVGRRLLLVANQLRH